jgi:hypothetical protein
MSMKATFKPHDVDDVEATLTATMPIAGWKRLRDQLAKTEHYTSYPTWQLLSLIRDMVDEMERKLTREVTNVEKT